MKVFIVMDNHWEYDDSNYYEADSQDSVGSPRIAFINEDEALKEVDRLTLKKLEKDSLSHYLGEDREQFILDKESFDELLIKNGMATQEECDDGYYDLPAFPSEMSKEDRLKVLECLDLQFFHYTEVEVKE